jgi:hypothetical protein
MSAFGFDDTDLRRGEGEWLNMQPVLRKSLGVIFDVITRQQAKITELESTVGNLKRELQHKTDRKDVERILGDFRLRLPESASAGEVLLLRGAMAELKADLERKATVRYVDEALRRKKSNADVAVKAAQPGVDYSKLSAELDSLKQQVEQQRTDKYEDTNNDPRADWYSSCRENLERIEDKTTELYRMILERPDNNAVAALLSSKVESTLLMFEFKSLTRPTHLLIT